MENKTLDEQVQIVLNRIKEKKDFLQIFKNAIPEKWLTKCTIKKDGENKTISVMQNENDLVELAGWLILQKEAQKNAKKLFDSKLPIGYDFKVEHMIQGFLIDNWLEDITRQIFLLRAKQEEQKLKVLEEKALLLTSQEQRRQIELEKLLKEMN